MNPISITVTGTLGADPRTFTLGDNTPGTELRLALDLPPRGYNGREITRWVKVTAYGLLATNAAKSFAKGDRVTVVADDLKADAWTDKVSSEARGQVCLRAIDIAASLRFDSVSTGRADRQAARAAAANDQPSDLPADQQADVRVLAGITATS